MSIDYNIFNSDKKSVIFFKYLPVEKNYGELKTDDFNSFDDITISETDSIITLSHIEEIQYYKIAPSNLSEVSDEFKFLVEITYEKIDIFNTKLNSSKKMQSIRLMTYEILSRDRKSELEKWPSENPPTWPSRVRKTHYMEIKPIKILERDCKDGEFELNLLIKEFLRGNKLDDLGI